MNNQKHKLLLVVATLVTAMTATAQHGIAIDLGKSHKEDTTHVTNLSVGITSNTDTLKGVQMNMLSNYARRVEGVQLSGFSNISSSPMRGAQLSAVTNISMGVENGIQASGLLNISSGYMRGLQVGAYNYADELHGAQIGVFNVAESHPKGWQIGLVNYTKDTEGHKIGLVNVNPQTTIDMMVFGGTSSKLNTAIRFRNRSTYNILGIGTHYMGFDKDFSGTIYYRLGQYVPLTPKLSISGDIGYFHIETFKKKSDEGPDRLFSLQARLNADYQLSKSVGLFASVGYGDTRYYHHQKSYRHRMLAEAGLTFRYPHNENRQSAVVRRFEDSTPADSLMAPGLGKKHPWWALAQVTGVNVFVHGFDRYALNADFAQTTLNTWEENFKNGFVWDNDQFSTNLFMHPYHGNLYFNSARSQGLTFWESAPFAMIGSLEWEFLGEIEPPAINDLIATTCGGICIGEITNRVSRIFLDDSKQGWPRFWRELGAAVFNPMGALKRMATGDAWRVRHDHYRYHDYNRNPVQISISAGDRYLADDGNLFKGEHNPYLNLSMQYGDPVNEDEHNAPYDFFESEFIIGLSSNQPLFNQLHLMGRLWSTPMIERQQINISDEEVKTIMRPTLGLSLASYIQGLMLLGKNVAPIMPFLLFCGKLQYELELMNPAQSKVENDNATAFSQLVQQPASADIFKSAMNQIMGYNTPIEELDNLYMNFINNPIDDPLYSKQKEKVSTLYSILKNEENSDKQLIAQWALTYFFDDQDVINDDIIGIGFIDDLVVLDYALNLLK